MTTKQKIDWDTIDLDALRKVRLLSRAQQDEIVKRTSERIWRMLREGGHVNEYGEWVSETWPKPPDWDDE